MTEIDTTAGTPGVITAPVMPVRDLVIFPRMMLPLFIGRPKTIRTVQDALKGDKRIVLVTQKDPKCDDPKKDDVYDVGTVGTVMQLLRLPDGTVKVLIEAHRRVRIESLTSDEEGKLFCRALRLDSTETDGTEVEGLRRAKPERSLRTTSFRTFSRCGTRMRLRTPWRGSCRCRLRISRNFLRIRR